MNLAYAVALFSSVCFGAGDLLGGLAARRAPAPQVAMLACISAIGVLVAAMAFIHGTPTRADLLWAAAAGTASTAGTVLIFQALALGPMSLASPVFCIVALSLPVVVGVALGERPSVIAWIGVALAVIAIPPLSIAAEHESSPSRAHIRRTLMVSLGGGLAAGCFLTCVGRIGSGAGITPLIVSRLIAIALLGIAFLARRQPLVPPAGARGMSAIAGVLDSTANAAYWLATNSAPLSLVAPLVSLAPAVTVVLARAVLGERWSGWQKVGLVLALASGVCISRG